jgi:hypothetical protein
VELGLLMSITPMLLVDSTVWPGVAPTCWTRGVLSSISSEPCGADSVAA